MPKVENPIDYGVYGYLKKRGYKVKSITRIIKEYALFIGMREKIDWLWIPEINNAIHRDFESFKEWVHENVENKKKLKQSNYEYRN
jgi:hypothetical protein